jgi:hypothetical protein
MCDKRHPFTLARPRPIIGNLGLSYSVETRSTELAGVTMADNRTDLDPSTWDPALDAVVAAPKHHKVVFENERLRVLEVTLEPNDEEPIHHHRWPSVFVFDQMQGPVHDVAPDGTKLPPNRDVMQAIQNWNGQGCLVVNMAPQPLGRVFNASGKTIHGIRVEMKANA